MASGIITYFHTQGNLESCMLQWKALRNLGINTFYLFTGQTVALCVQSNSWTKEKGLKQ